jgi:hypothetical protein
MSRDDDYLTNWGSNRGRIVGEIQSPRAIHHGMMFVFVWWRSRMLGRRRYLEGEDVPRGRSIEGSTLVYIFPTR